MSFWAWCIAVQDTFGITLDFDVDLNNVRLSSVYLSHASVLLTQKKPSCFAPLSVEEGCEKDGFVPRNDFSQCCQHTEQFRHTYDSVEIGRASCRERVEV